VVSGDIYVLCSDGLSGMVEDEDIITAVANATDLTQACRLLVRRANENGGEDNVTALLVRLERVDGEASADSDEGEVVARNTLPAGVAPEASGSGEPVNVTDDTPPAARAAPKQD
jgi:protein phosphatase